MKTTVMRASFLLRLRVHSDGDWVGQVEHIGSGWKEPFDDQPQLLERLEQMVTGSAPEAGVPETARGVDEWMRSNEHS